jgi:hypothetical protein
MFLQAKARQLTADMRRQSEFSEARAMVAHRLPDRNRSRRRAESSVLWAGFHNAAQRRLVVIGIGKD